MQKIFNQESVAQSYPQSLLSIEEYASEIATCNLFATFMQASDGSSAFRQQCCSNSLCRNTFILTVILSGLDDDSTILLGKLRNYVENIIPRFSCPSLRVGALRALLRARGDCVKQNYGIVNILLLFLALLAPAFAHAHAHDFTVKLKPLVNISYEFAQLCHNLWGVNAALGRNK